MGFWIMLTVTWAVLGWRLRRMNQRRKAEALVPLSAEEAEIARRYASAPFLGSARRDLVERHKIAQDPARADRGILLSTIVMVGSGTAAVVLAAIEALR
jgi:hypothetical protein